MWQWSIAKFALSLTTDSKIAFSLLATNCRIKWRDINIKMIDTIHDVFDHKMQSRPVEITDD
jgi:hypothetical protein